MPVTVPDVRLTDRGPSWKWWVCGLLLLATTTNYMDRLTLNQLSKEIMQAFRFGEREYGQLEAVFGTAFALGSLVMGWLADRCNVRWLYPAAVFAWSLAGFATGLAQTFTALLVCRFLLGLAEAGNWTCALRTTQHVLPAKDRPLGNGILQSGAALGAVITPLIVLALLALLPGPGGWRAPFLVIGVVGMGWVVLWLASVRSRDLAMSPAPATPSLLVLLAWLLALLAIDLTVHQSVATDSWLPLLSKCLMTGLGIAGVAVWLLWVMADDGSLPRADFLRRFAVLGVLVVTINATWHFFRAWLPLILQNQHGYSRVHTQWFSTAYYLSTDAGSLSMGFLTLALIRGGLRVHASRVLVFAGCAVVTTLSVVVAVLPAGWLLLGLLLIIGFAALGLFPNYYSFTQELTSRNQGKVTGALGCICWLAMSLLQEAVGDSVARTGSYTVGVSLAGLAPLLGVAALVFFWGKTPSERSLKEDFTAESAENAEKDRKKEAFSRDPSRQRDGLALP
jgi:ACS family hexuronate transporter-like MFS transporter